MFLKISQRPQENTYVGLYFLKRLQAADRRRVNLIFKDFSQFIITIVIKLAKEQNFKEERVKKGVLGHLCPTWFVVFARTISSRKLTSFILWQVN